MRRILVDYARQRGREKRGGDLAIVPLDEALEISPKTVKREWASATAWLHHELADR
jgi:hypothetical protein